MNSNNTEDKNLYRFSTKRMSFYKRLFNNHAVMNLGKDEDGHTVLYSLNGQTIIYINEDTNPFQLEKLI